MNAHSLTQYLHNVYLRVPYRLSGVSDIFVVTKAQLNFQNGTFSTNRRMPCLHIHKYNLLTDRE